MKSIWTPNESALSMFCANEEEWVDIIPLFGLDETVVLLNGSKIGPWEAGMSTRVPLWIARHLQNKSLAKITAPYSNNWMQVEPLKQILSFEKSHEQLWQNSLDDTSANEDNEFSTSSSRPYLPERYWELSQCYSTADNAAAVSLLLQDLWQVRLDKLRRQFQYLYGKSDALQVVNVTGIGSAELAVMRKVIEESLTLKASLLREPTLPPQQQQRNQRTKSANANSKETDPASAVATTTPTPAADAPPAATSRLVRARVAIRRFRQNPAPSSGQEGST
ncbi:hypothetical protein ACA910_022218 [Epithemia clementina (nom. ined.)]